MYFVVYSLDATRCIILHLAATQSLQHASNKSDCLVCGLIVGIVAIVLGQVCARAMQTLSPLRVPGCGTTQVLRLYLWGRMGCTVALGALCLLTASAFLNHTPLYHSAGDVQAVVHMQVGYPGNTNAGPSTRVPNIVSPSQRRGASHMLGVRVLPKRNRREEKRREKELLNTCLPDGLRQGCAARTCGAEREWCKHPKP